MNKKIWNRNKRMDQLLKRLETIKADINWDAMFDPTELKRLHDQLCATEEVEEREIFDYLFRECMAVHARIKKQGTAKGHRYSSIMIRFAIMLRQKMGEAKYEFFRKVLNLPCNSQLALYSCADASSPDGCMMETICQASEMLEELGVPQDSFHRQGNLSFDAHVIRDKLGFSHGSGILRGYGSDAFDIDAILEQFKMMADAEEINGTIPCSFIIIG